MNVSNNVFGVANAASLDAENDQFSQFFQKFLAATSPELVEHACAAFPTVRLGEVCSFRRPNGNLNKEHFTSEGLPYIQYGQIHKGEFTTVTDRVITYIDPIHCVKAEKARKGDVIVTDVSEDIENIGKSIVWMGEDEVVTSQQCLIATPDHNKLDGAYLAYFFNSNNFLRQKRRFTYGSSIFHIYARDIEKCLIPLPPIEVQRAISGFLLQIEKLANDKTYGIEKELNLRKEQLNEYLSKLTQKLRTPSQLVKLQDVASYVSEKVSTRELTTSNYISVENLLQDLAGKIDSPNVPEDQRVNAYQEQDILLGNINPYLHKIWFATYAGGCNQDVLIIRTHTPAILPKYLFFVLCAPEFWHYNDRFTRKGALTRGDKQQIMQYKFPLPSIEEQEKTISFLDKLYELTFDSQAGLEAMRQLRLQQLDYYLDKFF